MVEVTSNDEAGGIAAILLPDEEPTKMMKTMGGMLMAAFVGGGLASLVFSGGVSAQGSPPVVTAQQINLVNRAGKLRAILAGEDDRGLTSIALFDDAGARRMTLT